MNKSELASHGMTLTQIAQAIAHAVVDNGGTDEDTKRILSDEGLRNQIAGLILGKNKNTPVSTLIRILENESIVLDACDGMRTMANVKDVFTGWVDGDWKDYGLCNPGPATPATPAILYELVKGAKFKDFFMAPELPHLDAMCVTEGQHIGFAEKYLHLLGNYGAFMLVKKDWNKPAAQLIDGVMNFDNVFVAYASRDSGGLNSYVHSFGRDNVWRGGSHHRLLVPQLGA